MKLLRALLVAALCATPVGAGAWWQSIQQVASGGGGASLSCSYTPVTSATYNVAYTGATPSASGGTAPYTFSNTGSALPTGMSINSSTGVISGTDSTDSGGASYPGIQVTVTDNVSATANCGTSFTITVAPAAGTLTFGIDGTNYAGAYNTIASPQVCPSATCLVSGSSSTQYGIGTASSNRIVGVAFSYNGAAALPNAVISDVKINGTISGANCIGGTQAIKAFDSAFANGSAAASVWYAAVASGTTATVCYRYTGGNGWGGEGVVTVFSLTDSSGAGSISVSTTNTASPPSYSASCGSGCSWTGTTVPSGGIGIGVSVTIDSGFPVSTWTGTASPTKAVQPNDGVNVSEALVHWASSGNVTDTTTTTGATGWSGVIFAP